MDPTPVSSTVFLYSAILVISLVWFGWMIYRRTKILTLSDYEDRFNNWGERIKGLFSIFLGQKRILDKQFRSVGLMHSFIFWGFMVLLVNSLDVLLKGFNIHLIANMGTLGTGYLWLKDFTLVVVLIMVLIAGFRRAFIKPERLTLSWDASFVLLLIGILMVSDIIASGMVFLSGMALAPAGVIVGKALSGISPQTISEIYISCWWIHTLTLLGFLVFLPYSKHFHVVTALFNVFFRPVEPKQPDPLDIETQERFGSSEIEHFKWIDLLDLYSCTECGRCHQNCPATSTGKPLSPKELNEEMRHNLYAKTPYLLKDTEFDGAELIGEEVDEQEIWDCTTCKACEEACPLTIEFLDRIIQMRRHLVLEESRFDKLLVDTFNNLEKQGNPWGISSSARMDWAEGLDVSLIGDNPDPDILFWVGCAGAYDDQNKKVARANVKLFNQAGVDYALLGEEERCTGDLARRAGNEYLYSMLAESNIETLEKYDIDTIVANCPHCFHTLKNEYPQYGGDYRVIHSTEFFLDLLNKGRLSLEEEIEMEATFHDPCYLGRHNQIYTPPREILEKISGIELTEMEQSENKSFCCGAGGARMWLEEDTGERINHSRLEDVTDVGADTVVSGCPFCYTMMEDGIKETEREETLNSRDISEVLCESILSDD